MFKKITSLVIRSIKKQPLFSGIKFLGLTIGTGCVIIISAWVQNELSFDKFHKNSENIYRVVMDMGKYGDLAITPPPTIDKIKNDFPEIESAARIEYLPKVVVKNEDISFYEENGIFADPDFFNVFSFDLLSGNVDNLLDNPISVVLTRRLAQKYFGGSNAINKTLIIRGYPFKVTAVLENIPVNSHLQFDFIIPIQFKTLLGDKLDDWGNLSLYTYIKVNNQTNEKELNTKIKDWETPREESFFLQPLLKIHGDVHYEADNAKTIDRIYVIVFSYVAIFILLIACINYITLFLAASYGRSKEIAIMKVIGANRKTIAGDFIYETTIFIILSLFTSLILVKILIQTFNRISGSQISFQLISAGTLALVIILGIILMLIIGLWPALHLSLLKSQSIFKKNREGSGTISIFKNTMVLLQFAVTTVLIIGLLTVSKQLNFIQNKDLGFQKENVMYLPFSGIGQHYTNFKEKLLSDNSILNVSIKNSLPVDVADKTNSIDWPGKSPDDDILIEATAVGLDYFKTMGVNIETGRTFSEEITSDRNCVILNQKAIEQMNLTNPVGKTIRLWGNQATIIGIVNDVFFSLKENISPQIYYMVQDYTNDDMNKRGIILIKCIDTDIEKTLMSVRSAWTEFAPESPFTIHFLDQTVDNKYQGEKKIFDLIKSFAIISILISCLGLFGSATYSTQYRIKEIGIRKVNGAKVPEIMVLLNRNFIKWIFIAFVIATPVAWYAMHKWLENFAYKTTLSWWIFALAGMLALGIALLTVSFQSWKAATRNPVEALRYE